jgi:hypothetical protein
VAWAWPCPLGTRAFRGFVERGFALEGLPGKLGHVGVAACRQTDITFTAVFIDREGFFSVAHVDGHDAWIPPFRVGGPGGVPGGSVAMTKQNDITMTAVFIDRDGFLSVAHVDGTDAWQAPFRVGDPVGVPGGNVALCKQTDDILTAVFLDRDGFFRVAFVSGNGLWNAPVPIGGQPATPGGGISLVKQTHSLLTSAFFTPDGAMFVAHVTDTNPWVPPTPFEQPLALVLCSSSAEAFGCLCPECRPRPRGLAVQCFFSGVIGRHPQAGRPRDLLFHRFQLDLGAPFVARTAGHGVIVAAIPGTCPQNSAASSSGILSRPMCRIDNCLQGAFQAHRPASGIIKVRKLSCCSPRCWQGRC